MLLEGGKIFVYKYNIDFIKKSLIKSMLKKKNKTYSYKERKVL